MKKKFRTAAGLRMAVGSVVYKWFLKNKDALYGWYKRPKPPVPSPIPSPVPSPVPPPGPVTSLLMFDDINVDLIPKDAKAVAGYIGGHWPTYNRVVQMFPHARHLSVAVSTLYDADCLDVEPGDAPISLAPAWVKRQLKLRAQGVKTYNTTLPVLYTSASWGANLINACSKAGLRYGKDYFWWSAHYNPALGKHLCSPKCGFGIKVQAHATQFTDMALGKHLDESFVTPGFFK